MDDMPGRMLATPQYTAYLKIAEGCSNKCHYCAIPSIRGEYRSRSMASLLKEAKQLYRDGVRELIVTAQDSTRYGEDRGKNEFLPLLKELEKIGFTWIRILYAYPSRISDELLEYIDHSGVICKYLDMPVQHTCDRRIHRAYRSIK